MTRFFPSSIIQLLGVLLLASFLFASCKPGEWNNVIELSQKELAVGPEGGEFCVSANDFLLSELYVLDDRGQYVPTDDNYGRKYEGDDLKQLDIFLSNDWVEVRKKDGDNGKKMMVIKVETNDSETERSCYIGVFLGDYHDKVIVTQYPHSSLNCSTSQ